MTEEFPFKGIYPGNTCIHLHRSRVFIIALFIIKQLFIGDWLNKLWYIPRMKYCIWLKMSFISTDTKVYPK